jgi:RTX calcium-binding nonapeptide repeat (4 copies)
VTASPPPNRAAAPEGPQVIATPAQTPTSEEPEDKPPTQDPPEGAQTCAEGGPNCGISPAACSILGGPDDDILTGSPFDDILCGFGGDDELDGNGGNDVLVGGPGDDELNGGDGEDCLLTGRGEDELRGEQPGEPVAGERRDGQPPALVSPDGRCYRVRRLGYGNAYEPVAGSPSAVAPPETGVVGGPVRAAAFYIAFARLAAAQRAHGGATFPVTVSSSALFADGVIRQLLVCPTTVSGTLVYRARSPNATGQRLAKQEFTCTRPSEVVRIAVSPAVRTRLERRKRLRMKVRATVSSASRTVRVLLKVA